VNPFRLFRLIGAKKRRDLEWFPPWWTLGIRIVENRDHWQRVCIRPPLGFFTRNLGGQMFGGAQVSLEYAFYRGDGTQCTHVRATVAIRPKGYKSQDGAYTPPASGNN
jgi:hypothetical protein